MAAPAGGERNHRAPGPGSVTGLRRATQLDPLELEPSGPSVVAIGGGHGLATVLEALLGYASEVTGIVTVADDGGSSGRLTTTLAIPPPGDVRKCLLALSPEPSIFGELFGYRFEKTDVAGHSLGNLVLAALTDLLGDFTTAIRTAEVMLGSLGRVIPAAPHSLHLRGVIDGRVVDGQEAINATRGRVESLSLLPADVAAEPEALEAVAEADQIIIGPGSLYTSVISALMVSGMVEAIEAARANLIFVMNLVTQDAESLGLTGRQHVEELHRLTGLSRRGTLLLHQGSLEVPAQVERVVIDEPEAAAVGWGLAFADLADPSADWPQHHPIRLGQALSRLA